MQNEGGHGNEQYFHNAIRAVQNKKPLPEIDFTVHQMEDGTQVNTQERVCRGKQGCGLIACSILMKA